MPPEHAPLLSHGLSERRLRVADADVVWLRCVLEGYEGLATLYGDGSGVITLTTPSERLVELDELIDALCAEAAVTRLQPLDAEPVDAAHARRAPRSPSTR